MAGRLSALRTRRALLPTNIILPIFLDYFSILHVPRHVFWSSVLTYTIVASNEDRSISQGPGYWAMFTGRHGNMRPVSSL
jgi:hypothetical protein